VKDDEGSLYFHACLLIQRIHDEGRVESRSEPLSRHVLWPEREVGRPSYVPKAVRFLDEPSKAALAVKKLRSLKGQERDHIMGAMYESLNGESSVLAVTGQTPMFWFELLILQFAGASVVAWSSHSDIAITAAIVPVADACRCCLAAWRETGLVVPRSCSGCEAAQPFLAHPYVRLYGLQPSRLGFMLIGGLSMPSCHV